MALSGDDRVTAMVLEIRERHRANWRDKSDAYWFMRLVEEVGELGASLAGDHDDTPEHELIQIASICMNWLEKRQEMLMRYTKK